MTKEEALKFANAELKQYAAPLPPNTLTNADGTPYSAGYDESIEDAALRFVGLLESCVEHQSSPITLDYGEEFTEQQVRDILALIKREMRYL